MKMTTLCAAVMMVLISAPLMASAAEGGSIASKVEDLGKMTYLNVSDIRAVKRDGLLRVQVTFNNSSNDNQQVYYRFRWLDDDGLAVWEEEPWKPAVVYGRQKKVINVVSPSFKATDFRVELQSPKNEGATSSGTAN